MAGTQEGGWKAAATNKLKYGQDFYSRAGALGGAASRNGGFASGKVGDDGLTGYERARVQGSIGGSKSKRRKAIKVTADEAEASLENGRAVA